MIEFHLAIGEESSVLSAYWPLMGARRDTASTVAGIPACLDQDCYGWKLSGNCPGMVNRLEVHTW